MLLCVLILGVGGFFVADIIVNSDGENVVDEINKASFSVNLSIQPTNVHPKETVTITVAVANTGGSEGSYTAVLEINGVKQGEERITIAAGDRQSVIFLISKEDVGSYNVTVNDLSATFTVVASDFIAANTPTGPSTGEAGQTLTYSTSANSNISGSPEYRFDWGDGSYSNWSSSSNVSHSWSSPDTYPVRAQARASGVTSEWSSGKSVNISETFALSTSVSPSGGGSINVSPSSADGKYDSGTQVTLIASWNTGYSFSHWSEDASDTTSPITITMDRDKSVVANFKKLYVTCGTTLGPSAGKTNQALTFSTSADSNVAGSLEFRFDWGDGSLSSWSSLSSASHSWSSPGTYSVRAQARVSGVTSEWSSSKSVNISETFALSTSVSPLGSGSISPSSGTYDSGTRVTLTTSPVSGDYRFDHWSGTDNNYANPTTVTMNSDKSVTAYFISTEQVFKARLTGYPLFYTGAVFFEGEMSRGDTMRIIVRELPPGDQSIWRKWSVAVYDPSGHEIDDAPLNLALYDLSFTAVLDGFYRVKVWNSGYPFDVEVRLQPPVWNYAGNNGHGSYIY